MLRIVSRPNGEVWASFLRSSLRQMSSGYEKSAPVFKTFRQQLTETRASLLNAEKVRLRMANEDVNSQAAQEARMEKEREEKALEENEKERQRQEERRTHRTEKLLLKREKRIEHGIRGRMKVAAELKERRRKRVLEMTEKCKDFITLDNIDEKINEALEKTVDSNYALSVEGKVIDSPPSLELPQPMWNRIMSKNDI